MFFMADSFYKWLFFGLRRQWRFPTTYPQSSRGFLMTLKDGNLTNLFTIEIKSFTNSNCNWNHIKFSWESIAHLFQTFHEFYTSLKLIICFNINFLPNKINFWQWNLIISEFNIGLYNKESMRGRAPDMFKWNMLNLKFEMYVTMDF